MTHERHTIALCVFALVGCMSSDRRGPAAKMPVHNQASSNRTISVASDAAWQDTSCDIHRASGYSDAGALVREYVGRNDSLGFFVGGDTANDAWLLRAAECPGHLGGADGVGITARYRVDSLKVNGDSGWFALVYDEIAAYDPEAGVRPYSYSRVDTQLVVRTPYGWRLSGQVGDPLVSIRHAARVLRLNARDRTRIDSLAHPGDPSQPGA